MAAGSFPAGNWKGDAIGYPGKGTVERSYAWTLGVEFVEEHNTGSYEPRASDQAAEIWKRGKPTRSVA